jgi:hypothetical protein
MKETSVEFLMGKLFDPSTMVQEQIQWFEQAKEMEKKKHEKFNKFLNDEKELGISDLKTIERIQWYYNTYFNETFNTKREVKQTAVEWLQEQYYESEGKLTRQDFEQAKKMENEQSIKAYKNGYVVQRVSKQTFNTNEK